MNSILRYSAMVLGLASICIGLFMYEAEHKRLQNFLETLWAKLDDVKEVALSKHTNLLRGVSHIMSRALIRLLGDRALSLRVLAIAFCFSVASFGLSLMLLGFLAGMDPALFTMGALVLMFAGVYGVAPIFIKSTILIKLWAVPLIVTVVVLLLWLILDFSRSSFLIWGAFGIALCVTFLELTRRILCRLCQATSVTKIVMILVLNFVPFLLLVGLLYLKTKMKPGLFFDGLLSYGFASNAIPAFTSLLFLAVAITLVANHALWPVISRPVYALQELGVAKRKKLLCVAGVGLLGLSGITAMETVSNITNQIVKLL